MHLLRHFFSPYLRSSAFVLPDVCPISCSYRGGAAREEDAEAEGDE